MDFAIFANNWRRTDIIKGSNPNNVNDYADIMDIYDGNGNLISYGDGKVDYDDFLSFTEEWLWDANDPNTFSKSISTPKIIPQSSDFYHQQRQAFFAKYGLKEGKFERETTREAA